MPPWLSWVYLLAAVILSALGTTMMKVSHGFKRKLPTLLTFVCYSLFLIPLNLALKEIPVSVVYAVWSGLGTVFVTVIGLMFFKERLTLLKVVAIFLIILGVIGLELGPGR